MGKIVITRDWSEMNKDILSLIITRITHPSDHIRISAVCSSWRSVAISTRYSLPHSIPGLIVSFPHHRKFLNFPPSDSFYRKINVSCAHTCLGSYAGWLVLATLDHHSIYLLNPFIKRRRWLPRISEKVEKALLSSSPSCDEPKCVVLILFEEHGAAFCEVGDISWKNLEFLVCENECGFSDAVFFKGRFYVVDDYGKIYTCNLDDRLIQEESSQPSDLSKIRHKFYLVEMKGQICRVLRKFSSSVKFYYENATVEEDTYDDAKNVGRSGLTRDFRICRIDPGKGKWVGVHDLGEYALFLGMNNSVCLSELEIAGVKGNKVYFTDDRQRNEKDFGFIRPGKDMGIYDMGGSGIEQLCWTQVEWITNTDPSTVWVSPLPW